MKHLIWTTVLPLLLMACHQTTDECLPEQLVCEYMVNPVGIDEAHPRLKWKIGDLRQGAKQHAYKINVGTDSLALSGGSGNMWNPQKEVSQSMLVSYQGEPLQPFTKYYWTVQVWDKDRQRSAASEVASFETGMMQMMNWQGSWITDSEDITLKPAPYFRRAFNTTKKIETAKVYVAVAGLYELSINGQRVGDHQLDPTYTRFDRRNLYVTYDVGGLLRENNAIGVLLGNGWYNHQSTAVWYFHEAPWRARPRFCLDLRITYEDGSTETVSTDNRWKTSLSPVVFNSIYTAEHYDARLEQPGWDSAGFDDTRWKESIYTTAPSPNIVAQTLHPIRHIEEITPRSVRKKSAQSYIFDLGLNIAGVTRLRVEGEAGTILRVSHAELIDQEGDIDQSNIDRHYRPTDDSDPFQTDIYTLSGKGIETFSPRFNYKGFQYVEVVSSRPIELTEKSLTGVVMHSDVPPAGTIHSSSTTLNKIWEATNRSYLANLYGYPTDCPQREKNGWTGDAHIAIETGLYNFDGITVYEKWLADHQDEQQPNGVLPAIIPSNGWGYHWANGPDWTSTIAIIPWNIYLFYGDSHLLEACYDNIKRYVDHITELSPSYLTDWGLGDWVPVKSVTPKEYTSSIYYYIDTHTLSKAAKLLGKEADFEKYAALAGHIKEAINENYFNEESGLYGSGLQTELSAALYWGIVPELSRKKVAENLAQRVISDDKHIDVGLLGSKTILNALSENGYADLAYEVASQETFPSWGYWIVKGATTLAENFDMESGSRDNSNNHIMFGEISAWYYKALGGIKPDPDQPGFKHVILEPHFVPGLEHFEARYNGPYGEIVSSWKRSDGHVLYSVTIPPNSEASLHLHAKSIIASSGELIEQQENGSFTLNLDSGSYQVTIEE
jgi:alpha-L-rhamnosidase